MQLKSKRQKTFKSRCYFRINSNHLCVPPLKLAVAVVHMSHPILEIAQSNALQLVNTYSPVSEIEYKFHPGVIPIKTSCKS